MSQKIQFLGKLANKARARASALRADGISYPQGHFQWPHGPFPHLESILDGLIPPVPPNDPIIKKGSDGNYLYSLAFSPDLAYILSMHNFRLFGVTIS